MKNQNLVIFYILFFHFLSSHMQIDTNCIDSKKQREMFFENYRWKTFFNIEFVYIVLIVIIQLKLIE